MDSLQPVRQPKILFSGDVYGDWNSLFKRVAAVNKSNGPFDALFCVGQFFPVDDSQHRHDINGYFSGSMAVPVPTYFTGDYGPGAEVIIGAFLEEKLESNDEFRIQETENSKLQLCENLFWLRGSGIIDVSGLQVAYLSGKFSEASYSQSKGLVDIGIQRQSDFVQLVDLAAGVDVVDILLTNEWPAGVLNGIDDKELPAGTNSRDLGTAVAADLAKEIKPRYHIAGMEGIFLARDPYTNNGVQHVTRFIGLGTLGNTSKQKYLHALSPTPASLLSPADLATPVPGSTLSPYLAPKSFGVATKPSLKPDWVAKIESEQSDELQSWRFSGPPAKRRKEGQGRPCYDFINTGVCPRGDTCRFDHSSGAPNGEGGADKQLPLPKGVCFDFFRQGSCDKGEECRFRHTLEEDRRRKVPEGAPRGVCFDWFQSGTCQKGPDCRYRHTLEEGPPSGPLSPCWFCLSSPEVDAHLVVSVGEHTYLAMAKGGLNSSHCLLLPIEHFPSLQSLPSDAVQELQKYKGAVQKCFASKGMAAVMFERFLQLKGATHAHLQIVPIPEGKVDSVAVAFEKAADKEGFKFHTIPVGKTAAQVMDEVKRVALGGNYFMVDLPDGSTLVYGIQKGYKFPMQFGREVVAELLGTPEKADWKSCKMSREEEEVLVEGFKSAFQSFDIM